MQYCDKSLDKEIKNGLPSIQTISDVLVDVCNGLSFSHKKKIIHRDLKPANILYYNNKWVLADFGMSLLDNKSSVVTVPESLPGTIPYTAPEVMYYQSITPAADIFSLGVTLKEMLTGFNIWEYEPSTHLQSFNDKRKEYVKYFDELVMEMMKLKPEERPNEIQIIAENLYNIFINLNINANANIYGVDRFKKIYLAADAIKKTASADFIRVNNIHPSQP
jgi:serine/threonine protein kinase